MFWFSARRCAIAWLVWMVWGVSNVMAAEPVQAEPNWGVVGHYSTMATVLYLAGFSPKDAKAIALAAWGPDTDKRNAMSTNALTSDDNYKSNVHMLDNSDNPAQVIADQKALASQVGVILQTIKEYGDDSAKKAAYLSSPGVQNILHAFGDSFAHVEKDGTHYSELLGHAIDSKTGNDPDNPKIHSDAYRSYVSTLFNVASKTTDAARVGKEVISGLINNVTVEESDDKQEKALKDSSSSLTSSDLVKSPVNDCGYLKGCSDKPVGSQVNPKINNIYGVK